MKAVGIILVCIVAAASGAEDTQTLFKELAKWWRENEKDYIEKG